MNKIHRKSQDNPRKVLLICFVFRLFFAPQKRLPGLRSRAKTLAKKKSEHSSESLEKASSRFRWAKCAFFLIGETRLKTAFQGLL